MKETQELTIEGITGAKSLYDNMNREQYTKAEKRAALEICVIRDSLRSMNGQVMWIPREENPADCLTKLKGNVSKLVVLMRQAKYQLLKVEKEMTKRREFRERTGRRNPRPSQTVANMDDSVMQKARLSLHHITLHLHTRFIQGASVPSNQAPETAALRR